jgi:transposase-like protein
MGDYKAGEGFDFEKLQQLVGEGLSIKDIAAHMGVTARTISRHKRTLGLSKSPKPGKPLEEWRDKAAQLLEEEYSCRTVAQIVGVTEHRVAKHFPGRSWTPQQCGQYAVAIRRLNNLSTFPEPERRIHYTQEQR